MMNASEIRNAAKTSALTAITLPDSITQIDDTTYIFPVMVEDEQVYVKVALTTCNFRDTEKTKKFDLNEAVAAYETKKQERATKAAERASKLKAVKQERDSSHDDEVAEIVLAASEPMTAAQIHEAGNFDERVSKNKVISILRILGEQGRIKAIEGKPKTYTAPEAE